MRSISIVALTVVAVALSVTSIAYDRFPGDLAIADGLQGFRPEIWAKTMVVISAIGGALPMALLSLGFIALFWVRRCRAACITVAAGGLATISIPFLKLLIDRPRPSGDLIDVQQTFSGLSFPSGHALTAMVLFGLLFYLAPHIASRKRSVFLLRTVFASMILLMGLSRVYLGAHWPSDVLGGFVFGVLIVLLLVSLHQRLIYVPPLWVPGIKSQS